MKIAYFTDTFLPRIDGIVSTVHEHTQILTTMGHEVIIYAPTYPGFDKNQDRKSVV